jgi:hypothetical protein
MRATVRNDRILFGPLKDTDLMVLTGAPEFAGSGVSAMTATNGGVDVFATLPFTGDRLRKIQGWYLQNHTLFSR